MPTQPHDLALELDLEGGAVPVAAPCISWRTTSDQANWLQLRAEVELSKGQAAPVVREIAGADSVLVPWPFENLEARDRGTLRVRVEGPEGWSEWSEPKHFWSTAMAEGEWQAELIGLPEPSIHAQPSLLRKEFVVGEGLVRATWYATAHGVYQAWLNGVEVDDQFMKPGWTPYQYRLIHESTDITKLVQTGNNAIGVMLAGGWYTERYGFQGQATPFYGEQPSMAGQLLLEYEDGRTEWVITDATWKVMAQGPLIESGLYKGETYDARKYEPSWAQPDHDDDAWQPVAVAPMHVVPGPRTSPSVRVTEAITPQEIWTSPSGKTLVDFGQNFAGRIRIRVQGAAGTTITLRHAEVLDNDELGVRPLRVANATDHYTLAGDGIEEWAPRFTFHGFRYAEVDGWPGELQADDLIGEVIHSDMRRTGWFECSHELVNRLHDNVIWGMRSNFLYLPTDCPQRDERLGWTGDIQIFAPTASYLYDTRSFLSSWLVDLGLEQEASDGCVAFVVPDVLASGRVPAAAWGDAATVVPMTLYERFGDLETLRTQYSSMKAWVDLLLGMAGDRYLWEGGFQFGDWVDPDAPPHDAAKAKTDADLVASAFLFRSTRLVAEAAGVLGEPADEEYYGEQAELVRKAWLHEYVSPAGRIVSDAQTAYAMAVVFGIAEGELKQRFGDRLAHLARRDGFRISTGFVGTPLVTDALTQTGHAREASRMLRQTECPSWLYSVTMGATTIWERWDSLLPDGTINPGEMTSFNHYALGSVADWLHRSVAGIAPASPGYKKIAIAPTPIPGLDWAAGRFDSPYGPIKSRWQRQAETLVVNVQIPANTTATVLLPGKEPMHVGSGAHSWELPVPAAEESQPITMDTPLSAIMDDEAAYEAILKAFYSVSDFVGTEFQTRTKWLPNQPLSSAVASVAPAVKDSIVRATEEFNEELRGRSGA